MNDYYVNYCNAENFKPTHTYRWAKAKARQGYHCTCDELSETEGGVYEFPIQLKTDESDSDESKATEMEVEIHNNYSVKYNAEEGILFIRYYKLGISILLRYIKNEWELIR